MSYTRGMLPLVCLWIKYFTDHKFMIAWCPFKFEYLIGFIIKMSISCRVFFDWERWIVEHTNITSCCASVIPHEVCQALEIVAKITGLFKTGKEVFLLFDFCSISLDFIIDLLFSPLLLLFMINFFCLDMLLLLFSLIQIKFKCNVLTYLILFAFLLCRIKKIFCKILLWFEWLGLESLCKCFWEHKWYISLSQIVHIRVVFVEHLLKFWHILFNHLS